MLLKNVLGWQLKPQSPPFAGFNCLLGDRRSTLQSHYPFHGGGHFAVVRYDVVHARQPISSPLMFRSKAICESHQRPRLLPAKVRTRPAQLAVDVLIRVWRAFGWVTINQNGWFVTNAFSPQVAAITNTHFSQQNIPTAVLVFKASSERSAIPNHLNIQRSDNRRQRDHRKQSPMLPLRSNALRGLLRNWPTAQRVKADLPATALTSRLSAYHQCQASRPSNGLLQVHRSHESQRCSGFALLRSSSWDAR